MKKILLFPIFLIITLHASQYEDGAIESLKSLLNKFSSHYKSCKPKNKSGYAGGVYLQSCMQISCTSLLGSIPDKYYTKYVKIYNNCKNNNSKSCKRFTKIYKQTLIIDKTCNQKIVTARY